jgi:hypothetical protein
MKELYVIYMHIYIYIQIKTQKQHHSEYEYENQPVQFQQWSVYPYTVTVYALHSMLYQRKEGCRRTYGQTLS